MKLLYFEDYEVRVNPEALLVRPIRRLYNEDRSARKEKFFQQMSYCYFMCDPRSTYNYIIDKEERKRIIIEQEGLPEDFTPSKQLEEAMEWYKKHTVTASQRLLESALIAADTVSTFLRDKTIFNKTDDKGRPMYQISSVTAALKNVEGIVNSLQTLQKKVEQELEEDNGKARGTQELTLGDVGLD